MHFGTRGWYLAGLFLLLLSNGIAGALSAVGVNGFAFYDVQAAVLALGVVHAATLLIAGRLQLNVDRGLLKLIAASLLYTIVSGLLLLRFADVSSTYVLLILHTLMFYPATSALVLGCASARRDDSLRDLPPWMSAAAVMVILFGWLQFIVRDPLLRNTNGEHVSKLVQTSTLGTFRPPSVFESSFQFGMFSLLVACLSIARIATRGPSFCRCAVALLGASGVMLSQTRNVLLCAVCAAVSFALMKSFKRGWRSKLLRVAPLLYAGAATLVLAYAIVHFLGSGFEKSGDLSDTSSTWARVSSWMSAWDRLVAPGGWMNALVGYGITQPGQASDYRQLYPARAEGLFIDNTFVNLFLLQGIVGLGFFLTLWWKVWNRLLARVSERRDGMSLGLAVFFSCFLAAGMFNIINGQWWGISLALALLGLSDRPKTDHERLMCVA